MTEAKHTPGPWEVRSDADGVPCEVWAPDDQDGGTLIAVLPWSHTDTPGNAHAIAAAPALLAALESAQKTLAATEEYLQDSPVLMDVIEDHERARAAIRQARGES